ncbi:MAG TPA: TolC family protein, partial [Accumulibacter sp.]|nr:TolC family protein [Accumulibacter sp.]
MKTIVSRQLRLVAVCTTGLLVGLSVQAAETPKSGLATAVEQAWRLNPQAAGLDAREAEARAAQDVAAGLTPEPGSVSIGSLNDRLNRNQGKQEYDVELAVPLWLPGQRAAREAETASRVEEAVARRAAVRLDVGGELREAWWTLAAARSAKMLAARRLETARALETNVMRRYKVGELSRIDANLAQTETHVANADLIEAEATLLQAEQAVQTLIGSPAPKDLDEESPTMRRLIDDVGNSAESHPLLAATAASARSARARVQVANESFRAAPELTLRVVRERGDFAESYSNSVGIKLKIPFSSGSQVRRETSAA